MKGRSKKMNDRKELVKGKWMKETKEKIFKISRCSGREWMNEKEEEIKNEVQRLWLPNIILPGI